MLDMTDVINMSKIADHYLVEYETLLNSSEMQAPNVSDNFRDLSFTDFESSNIDYNSDDWASGSLTETSALSGELMHSPKECPEYMVSAGSKPLSIIIRRCSTPTSVGSSPSRKVNAEVVGLASENHVESAKTKVSKTSLSSRVLRSQVASGSIVSNENPVVQVCQLNDNLCKEVNCDHIKSCSESKSNLLFEHRNTCENHSESSLDLRFHIQENGKKAFCNFNCRSCKADINSEQVLQDLCSNSLPQDDSVPQDSPVNENLNKGKCNTTSLVRCQIDSDSCVQEKCNNKQMCQSNGVCLKAEINSEEFSDSKSVRQSCTLPILDKNVETKYVFDADDCKALSSYLEILHNNERGDRMSTFSQIIVTSNKEASQTETKTCTSEKGKILDNFSDIENSKFGSTGVSDDINTVETEMCSHIANDTEKSDVLELDPSCSEILRTIGNFSDVSIPTENTNFSCITENECLPDTELSLFAKKLNVEVKEENSATGKGTPVKSVKSSIQLIEDAGNVSLILPLPEKSLCLSECTAEEENRKVKESATMSDLSKLDCNVSLHLGSDNLIDVNNVLESEVLESACADYSPLLFSSDDESPSFKNEVNKRIEAVLASSPGHSAVISHEKCRLSKLQELLVGAPPPPSITMPQCSVLDMLKLLKENQNLMVAGKENVNLSVALAFQEAATAVWPKAKHLQYPGIHYNHGVVSENFESLCQKLQERFVGNETASTCTPWRSFANTTAKPKRPVRKSASTASTASPGRRLSHLARRQRMFSSSNLFTERRLQNILPCCEPERRMILVDVKKKSSRKLRSSQKKSTQVERRDVPSGKLNSSKRALFQSPNEEEKERKSVHSKLRVPENHNDVMRSRRALFVDNLMENEFVGTSRKRRCEDSEDGVRKMPRRALFADGEGVSQPCSQGKQNDLEELAHLNKNNTELSSYHKKKLLWAVAEALKQKGVGITHPSFRVCAAALAARCRAHIHKLLTERRGSTSDRMLSLASEFVGEVTASIVKEDS